MGFFSELGKAFMGKPLGPAGDQQADQPAQVNNPQQGDGILDEKGLKIIPDIDVKNVNSDRIGDDKLTVRAWIENKSDQEIKVEWSQLLKQKVAHKQFIGPRASRELKLYDGRIPDNENERSAQIAFSLQVNGDMFMENYRINYDLQNDGKFVVGDLIDDGPVRDL